MNTTTKPPPCCVEGPCDCKGFGALAVQWKGIGQWYITTGHAGFNSPANNGQGYVSEQTARQAIRRYESKGKT
jgi:hypothetical protein